MAGHSKWHNIQHRKGTQDAKRGKVFTKLIKEIVVAAKMGGGVIENNPSLRAVIDKALAANMKRDTVDNAIKRGAGDLDGDNYEEVRYEGYGLGGTAIMVDCLTDNRNRTVADVVGSTTQLIEAAASRPENTFIVATDNGIFHKMHEVAPGKKFIEAPTMGVGATCESCAHCDWMAMNSLEKCLSTLTTGKNEIRINDEVIEKAKHSIHRLLEFTQ